MSLPIRHSVRLKGYDYSQEGAYFVTICTKDRECLFGEIIDGKMMINNIGEILNQVIQQTPLIRKNVQIDMHQIMPNHVHIILIITDRVGAYCNTPLRIGQFQSPSHTIGSIIRGIKSVATRQIRIIMSNPQFPVFQRNFYEHIIRNEKELSKIREYIKFNPQMWDRDRSNPNVKDIDFEKIGG